MWYILIFILAPTIVTPKCQFVQVPAMILYKRIQNGSNFRPLFSHHRCEQHWLIARSCIPSLFRVSSCLYYAVLLVSTGTVWAFCKSDERESSYHFSLLDGALWASLSWFSFSSSAFVMLLQILHVSAWFLYIFIYFFIYFLCTFTNLYWLYKFNLSIILHRELVSEPQPGRY